MCSYADASALMLKKEAFKNHSGTKKEQKKIIIIPVKRFKSIIFGDM